ncbi:MAG: branched-chain amino acid ABC transporter permease [Rhodospirillaceae bacterium]|nr:branched-chain amino acid ABC transporter permease [Rhodospirillaceae bacterium]MYH35557.1 branched-chain amino acid ABC transporter permease [Rhodospirillaceae bacterium]MYK14414.1 branched-chain amino acid ABC transporter permease [Rhodospirillaceae bacterium]
MPEVDFIETQVAREDTRSLAEKVRDRLALGGSQAVLFAAFMVGLALEDTVLVTGFLLLIVAGAVGWGRLPRLNRWAGERIAKDKRFAQLVLVALLAAFPFFFLDNPYLIHLGALAAIFAIMALGLNITLGFCGLLDVGFAVYFAAGAYMSSQLAVIFDVSFWIGLPLGGLTAAFFGFLVAWPALRVSDHYLALVTLGYGLIMNLLHRNFTFLTHGTDGVINIPPPSILGWDFVTPITIGELELPFQMNFYFLALIITALTIFVSIRLRDSNLGRQWEAIREDEVAARCFGVNVTRLKIIAFSTGAFFGGIGGAVFAHMIGFVHPDNFVLLTSIMILAMVIIGGMGNIAGVVVGAVALTLIPERLREFEDLRMLLFGGALVLIMIYRPQGLFPNSRRRRELQAEKINTLIAESGRDDAEAAGLPDEVKA